MKIVVFKINNLVDCQVDQSLEKKLKATPHIIDAFLDSKKGTIRVAYMDEMISEKQIKNLLSDCGFVCTPLPILSSKKALAISKHKLEYKKSLRAKIKTLLKRD